MKIGIYGGAFDPPHLGHARAAKRSVEFLGLDLLYIVPAYIAPLKNGPSASPEQRLEMCHLAFDSEKERICDYEIVKGGISFTKDTVKHFLGLYPNDTLYLIIGTDQLMQLDRWSEPEYIFSHAIVAVVPRYEDIIPEEEFEKYEKIGARIVRVDAEVTEVSSTEIRGGDRFGMLSNKVKEYIKVNGLYR